MVNWCLESSFPLKMLTSHAQLMSEVERIQQPQLLRSARKNQSKKYLNTSMIELSESKRRKTKNTEREPVLLNYFPPCTLYNIIVSVITIVLEVTSFIAYNLGISIQPVAVSYKLYKRLKQTALDVEQLPVQAHSDSPTYLLPLLVYKP